LTLKSLSSRIKEKRRDRKIASPWERGKEGESVIAQEKEEK